MTMPSTRVATWLEETGCRGDRGAVYRASRQTSANSPYNSRRKSLVVRPFVFLAWMALAGTTFATDRSTSPPKKPRLSVLFLAVDDLRPELRCYGADHIHSPHIDALARSGLLFERAYCMVSVCGASRASLMTGIRPSRSRFTRYDTWAEKDAPGVLPLHAHFKRHGYHTVSLGKVFHHMQDCREGWSEPPWRLRVKHRYHIEKNAKIDRKRRAQSGRRRLRGPAYEAADRDDLAYADGMLAERAIRDLRRLAAQEKPFFLAVGFFKPHLPFVAPKKYWDLYDAEKIHLPSNHHPPRDAPRASLHHSGELRAYAGIPAKGPIPEPTGRRLIHGYYACVSFIDAQIGKVLQEVERLGIGDRTIIVLWSDHGWNLGEHTLWCKHSCYETSMRIPLIVRVPGIPGGRRSSRLIETIDLYPTLCELVGIEAPGHVEGRSFAPLLRDPDGPWKSAAIGRYGNGDTVRTDRYRYARYVNRSGRFLGEMLYDHVADPGEDTNIAARPDVQEVLRSLRTRLAPGEAGN